VSCRGTSQHPITLISLPRWTARTRRISQFFKVQKHKKISRIFKLERTESVFNILNRNSIFFPFAFHDIIMLNLVRLWIILLIIIKRKVQIKCFELFWLIRFKKNLRSGYTSNNSWPISQYNAVSNLNLGWKLLHTIYSLLVCVNTT